MLPIPLSWLGRGTQKWGDHIHIHVQVERTLLLSGEWKVRDLRISTENYPHTYVSLDNLGLFYVHFYVSQKSQNTKFVAIRCVISSRKCTKIVCGRGSDPDPAGGA